MTSEVEVIVQVEVMVEVEIAAAEFDGLIREAGVVGRTCGWEVTGCLTMVAVDVEGMVRGGKQHEKVAWFEERIGSTHTS